MPTIPGLNLANIGNITKNINVIHSNAHKTPQGQEWGKGEEGGIDAMVSGLGVLQGQYTPLETELWGEGNKEIKPNTKYFKNGLYDL